MVQVLTILTSAQTILLLPSAIVYHVQEVVLRKQFQRPEDTAPVHVGHPLLHIVQGKRFCLHARLFPYQYPHCRRFYAVSFKVLLCFIHEIFRFSRAKVQKIVQKYVNYKLFLLTLQL
jgi:hypothetical protein